MSHSLVCPIPINTGPDAFEESPFSSEIRVLGEHFPEYYCDYLEQCTKQVMVDFFGPDFGQLCFDPYSELPLIEAIFPTHTPGLLRIALFCESTSYTNGADRHMADLFNHWLVPGETLNIPCSLAVSFVFTANPQKKFFLCHLLLSLESDSTLFRAKKEIADLISVLKKTISSVSCLKRTLEKKMPNLSSLDLNFYEQANALFKIGKRNQTLVARIMGLQYLFCQQLKQKNCESPNTRPVALRIFPLKQDSAQINVLGLLVGLCLIREGELFEEKHFIKAIRKLIPDAKLISDPFIHEDKDNQKLRLLYTEIKKESGLSFSRQEIIFLRTHLAKECRASVETLIHPLFMPRNDEDLLRFSLQLCNQLDDDPSSPQLAIFFGNQTTEILSFSVIIARMAEKHCPTTLLDSLKQMNALFECADVEMRYPPCSEKHIRKEVISFTAKLPKDPYLRSDYAIDVLQARQQIVRQLQEIFGPIRDFNGGLFETQLRAEQMFLASLEDPGQRELDLAKNFFHAITPTLMQIILDTALLKKIYLLLLHATRNPNFSYSTALEHRHEIIVLKSPVTSMKKDAQRITEELSIPASKLIYSLVEHGGECYLIIVHQNDGERHFFLYEQLKKCVEVTI